MYFHQTIVAAIVAASSVLGAPLEVRTSSYFTPSAIWRYNTANGAISATTVGYIDKSTTNGGQDTTALITFTYPQGVTGMKCQFAFFLDGSATLSGSRKIDLFTVNNPAPGPRPGWGPGNQRNIHLGRLTAAKPGQATWDATYSAYLTQKTDCKAPGTIEGFELVGVYDRDLVSWNPSLAGPRIIYSSS
ncbi:hypothetical protein B0I35DRAFT_442322 [Stachybotrys elegans]|uniref:Ubiquitin 3 binding protein But2 C-terminal domain-containing protein n=1 Tax=Stachybotrys elegans TaxID=80388 RepID=A0A8K0WN07_9HYPO|nr:hypothetical protein B0I35DRAFT_442322 [Stachybotrys elegans]